MKYFAPMVLECSKTLEKTPPLLQLASGSPRGGLITFKQLLQPLKILASLFQNILEIYSMILPSFRILEEYFQEFTPKSLFSRNF